MMARFELVAVEHGAEARRGGAVVASLRGELRTDERRGRQAWISADGDASAFAELYARHKRTIAQASMVDALLVGIAQVGALIPGVSRSGSTLTAALALGFQRDEAARFSFLLGLPAIALAGLKELWELHKVHLGAHGWSSVASLR